MTASHFPGAAGLITENKLQQIQADEKATSEKYLIKIASDMRQRLRCRLGIQRRIGFNPNYCHCKGAECRSHYHGDPYQFEPYALKNISTVSILGAYFNVLTLIGHIDFILPFPTTFTFLLTFQPQH